MKKEESEMVRKANLKDVDEIAEIYMAIHDAEERGELTIGWSRGIYPVRGTAEEGIERGDLFVCEDGGRVVAAGIINQIQVPEYRDCQWGHDSTDEEVMVLHTLVVDPTAQARGYGTEFMSFYEVYALERGCHHLRMDTQEKNHTARAFYKKLGFSEPGIVFCTFNGIPHVRLVCLEKEI